MFRRAKLTLPVTSTSTSSASMNRRCLSAKEMIASMGAAAPASGPAAALLAACGAIDEQRPARHHALADLKPLQHLQPIVPLAPETDLTQGHVVVGRHHHPDPRAIAFVDHRLPRHRR